MSSADTTISRSYRFYFTDSDGHIAKALDIESSSDTDAGDLAAIMLSEQSDYPGIEVWERARQVACLSQATSEECH